MEQSVVVNSFKHEIINRKNLKLQAYNNRLKQGENDTTNSTDSDSTDSTIGIEELTEVILDSPFLLNLVEGLFGCVEGLS